MSYTLKCKESVPGVTIAPRRPGTWYWEVVVWCERCLGYLPIDVCMWTVMWSHVSSAGVPIPAWVSVGYVVAGGWWCMCGSVHGMECWHWLHPVGGYTEPNRAMVLALINQWEIIPAWVVQWPELGLASRECELARTILWGFSEGCILMCFVCRVHGSLTV